MRTVLVTGSDTGVGKTRVVAMLARLLTREGARVQIVKVVETGVADAKEGDAQCAARLAGISCDAYTLASYQRALAPAAAAKAEGRVVSWDEILEAYRALPACEWRIVEGAGGAATPVDESRDWSDFAAAIAADKIVVVVPDRLGAINQARLAYAAVQKTEICTAVWLNEVGLVDSEVAASNRSGLIAMGVPICGESARDAMQPKVPTDVWSWLTQREEKPFVEASDAGSWKERCTEALAERARLKRRRTLRVTRPADNVLNLADNDYLELSRDPVVVDAVRKAVSIHGASASASPLITGWREPHEQLLNELGAWHRFSHGLLWTSGYAANCAVLGSLPKKGDLVLADRLIHHSLIAGVLRSGAQLRRYDHLRIDQLEEAVLKASPERKIFVVTESVFSMDGDYPDLGRIAKLKRWRDFCWIVDEAHGVGWYGPEGSGLARAQGIEVEVDILVGTLGKALGSGGAYTLFRDECVRDYLVEFAGEFIFSTALSPVNVAAAHAALGRVKALSVDQAAWHERSRNFRAALRVAGWQVPEGDAPIVPVILGDEDAALARAERLRGRGIWVSAIRPPTVPNGTSRLRISLKRTFGVDQQNRVLEALGENR